MASSPVLSCFGCRYYYVTYDQNFPRGCRLFGIKSRQMPAIEVRKATGRNCPSYASRNES